MSKEGKSKQGPKDGEDKSKKKKRGENKDLILDPQAASEYSRLNHAISFT